MERMIFIFAILSLGHGAVNLHNGHTIALKLHGYHEKWLSCWGSGGNCQLHACPDLQSSPFAKGDLYGYNCRGQIFWIHKQGGGYIKSCDVVALMYETGWWLSCSDSVGSQCSTRTCPGVSWGGNWDRCGDEKFRIKANGKACGDNISQSDIVVLYTKEVVSQRNLNNKVIFTSGTNVIVGKSENEMVPTNKDNVTPSTGSYKFQLFIDL